MAKLILGVTISPDGFAEDSKGSVEALYPDLDSLHNTDLLKESIRTTGYVVMAQKEYAKHIIILCMAIKFIAMSMGVVSRAKNRRSYGTQAKNIYMDYDPDDPIFF